MFVGSENPKPIFSERSGNPRRSRLAAYLYAGGALLLTGVILGLLSGCQAKGGLPTSSTIATYGPGFASPRLISALIRPVYPMSVIAGGAYTTLELRWHIQRDPIVRRSFEAMANRLRDPALLDHLYVAQVPRETQMHSLLRDGDKLYWSQKPVTIHEGETGFYHSRTGDLVARARCGNALLPVLPPGAQTRPPPPEPPKVIVEPEAGVRATPQIQVAASPRKRAATQPPPAPPPEPEIAEQPPPLEEPPSLRASMPPDTTSPLVPEVLAEVPQDVWSLPGAALPSPTGTALPSGGAVPPAVGGGFPWVPAIGGGLAVLVPPLADDDHKGPPKPPPIPELPVSHLLGAGGGAALFLRWWLWRGLRRGRGHK